GCWCKAPYSQSNEFDMWKMRIEQNFLMTDYSLWEVILNGDSPTPTRIVDGVVQVIASTTAKRLAKQNELKTRGTLLMALLIMTQALKALIKFMIGFKILSASWRFLRNKADLEEQSLDDLFNNLKIYEAEVKSSSTTSHNTQNIAFVSSNNTDSTNESVNVIHSVSAASSKALVSTLLNVGSLSDVMIYSFFASQSNSPQLDNEDLKQIDADNLKEMDHKWQIAMLTMRARRGHFARICRSPRDNRNKDTQRRTVPVEVSTSNALVSQCNGVGSYDWSFQVDEELTNYALMAFTSSGSSSSSGFDNESDDRLPTSPMYDRYKSVEGYHAVPPPYTGTFMPSKPDLVFNDALPASEIVPNVVNVESSTNKTSKETSKTLRPDAPIIEDWTSDSEDDSEIESVPKQKEPSFVQTSKHVKPPRASVKPVEHPKQAKKLKTDIQKSRGHNRKACFVCKSLNHLIKDCDFYEKQMVQSLCGTIPVSTAVPQTTMKSLRTVKHVVNKAHLPIRRPINHRPAAKNSNFYKKVTTIKISKVNAVKGTKGNWVWKPKYTILDHVSRLTSASMTLKKFDYTDAFGRSNGCSRYMTGNISYLSDFKEINGGYVTFGGNPKGGKITGKGKIKTGKLDFNDVYFVKELKFNLFSVSQICDKKNNVLFTDTECVILSSDFKLPDENHVLLMVLRENNMYNVNLKNVVPLGDLTCLFAKATLDESNLWHKRLGHINFKAMNKLVKGNLVRGLPSKVFENNHTCVACKKGKQHRASCKSKPVSSVSYPLQRLHMDLFGPTFVKSLNKKSYCLVVTDDYKRKNRTPIEAARTMLADSLLPIPFWAEAVNTACYVQNKVLVIKPHNKTPYELLLGRTPSIGFMKPFGCLVTILNTLDPLEKFDGKADEGFLVGYSINIKAFRVFNSRTRTVQETLHISFLENQPNVVGSSPKWLFDIDTLTQSMNYQPVFAGNPPDCWKVWILVDLPKGKHDIGTKWVYRNKKDKKGIVVRNKARLVAQGYTQEEGIDYDEIFALVARIEVIRLFLAYASFMVFVMYQIDVKSAFLYGTIEEEVYVCQPPGFEDPHFSNKVYKVEKALYGLYQAPRA
nr:retrovirus-related Pol polyprotein from transposon TNT 1-94 [Tanacetum cinerariifolium]